MADDWEERQRKLVDSLLDQGIDEYTEADEVADAADADDKFVKRDDAHGVTDRSLEFFDENEDLFGEFVHAWFVYDKDAVDYELHLEDNEGDEMILTGCSLGYTGEGPQGTLEILQRAGFLTTSDMVDLIFGRKPSPARGNVQLASTVDTEQNWLDEAIEHGVFMALADVGWWEKAKEIGRNIKARVINTFRDFMGVAQQNGFIVLGPGAGTMAAMADAERKQTPERGRYLDVPKEDVVVPEVKDAYDPHEYAETFEKKDAGDADWLSDESMDPNVRVLLVQGLNPGESALKSGNLKISQKLGIFSLPCRSTCPESTDFCKKFCYAKKAEDPSFRKHVLPYRERRLTTSRDPRFPEIIGEAIERGHFGVVRVHESGDFYNKKYFDKWIEVAGNFPSVTFFAFTKNFKLMEQYEESCDDKPQNFVFNGSLEVSTEYSVQEKEEAPYSGMKFKDINKDEGPKGKGRQKWLEEQGAPIEKVKQYQNLGDSIRKPFAGSTQEKIESFLKNPSVAGLAIIIPKGTTLEDTLWALGLDEASKKEQGRDYAVKPGDVFICPYQQSVTYNDPDTGEVKTVESMGCGPEKDGLCPFCWLTQGVRQKKNMFINGIEVHHARHVAFHQH